MAFTTHEVVILGANFAGITLTHYLHRQVFPELSRLNSSTKFKVTLVSPNSHFFFKVAAPRALINATAIPVEKIFKPISEPLQQYGDACNFVQAKATALNPEAKSVTVRTADGAERDLRYDSLFICTGTTSSSPLWTLHDDHEVTIRALKEMHGLLPKTKTVVIGGAGPVGVETAGEIAAAYPDIKITLVAGGEVLDTTLSPGPIAKAKRILNDAKVEVLSNIRVNSTSSNGSETTVQLSDGTSRTVDLFIDSRGAHKINSEFIPKAWLDTTGRVTTRDSYFRVKGDGASDVYAIGDIVSGSANTAIELDPMVTTAASSFAVDVATKLGHKTNVSGGLLSFIPGFSAKGISQKEFKPMKGTCLVPIGPESGAGQIMGFSVPSFVVKKAKGQNFLCEMIEPMVTGMKFSQA